MEGDAISSVYILLYAATITTLSLSVYTVCVCVHLMKDRARSSREPGGFIQYDGAAAYRSYSRQSIQRQASVMMSPSRSWLYLDVVSLSSPISILYSAPSNDIKKQEENV
jgi:hypothetical protein